MTGLTADVSVKDAIRVLRRFGDEAKRELKDMNREAAKMVEQESKRLVPVRSGALRSSIRSSGVQKEAVVRSGNSRVPYAGPIHFGWNRPRRKWGAPGVVAGGRIAASSFQTDARDNESRAVLAMYRRELERIAEKYSA